MILRPIDNQDEQQIATWLAAGDICQFLDVGGQPLGGVDIRALNGKASHCCRVFTEDTRDIPIGLVGLSHVGPDSCTGFLWYLLGEREFCGRGYTSRAVSRMLTMGFSSLGLRSINAWAVDQHVASIRVLQRNNFRFIGRLRQCHTIQGKVFDRLLFDLLTTEHREP